MWIRRDWSEIAYTAVTTAGVVLIGVVFLGILAHIAIQGAAQISWEFLWSEPINSGRSGGILPIIVSTLMILVVCLLSSLPLGLATAILLAEYEYKPIVRWIRYSLEVLAGVPSIVFGLFGNAFFSKTLGLGFSILSGGLTLACMVLPIFIRIAEEGFRQVPKDYRRNAAALGFTKVASFYHLLLPAAMPSIIVGLVLGVGRALAETAALIFTSGYVDRMPESWLDSGRALSIHIYDLSMNVPGGNANAYASSLVLISLLIIINTTATAVSRFWTIRS